MLIYSLKTLFKDYNDYLNKFVVEYALTHYAKKHNLMNFNK